jgi:hypothetical protein
MMPFSSPNYTQTPNDLFDELLPAMSCAELKVVLAIIRGTFGYHRCQTDMSITEIEKMTGLSGSSVLRGIGLAEESKLIKGRKNGKSGRATKTWTVLTTSNLEVGQVPLKQRVSPSKLEGQVPLKQRVSPSKLEEGLGLKKGERKKERGKKEHTPAAIAELEQNLEVVFTKSDIKTFSETLPEANITEAKKFVVYWKTVDGRGKRGGYPPTPRQIIGLWKLAQNGHKPFKTKYLPLHKAKR